MSCKGCCFPLLQRYSSRSKVRRIVLMLVGLDNAGKTCTARGLAGEPVDTVVPTVGFNSIKLKHKGYSVIIYDLGGSSQIRGIWPRYYADVHGVIFVVDASDISRIDESRKALEELLADNKLAGKPVLLLANKQDQEGALDELDIVERLDLESLVNAQKCPTLVETCSAAGAPSGGRVCVDPGILNGYRWLLGRIIGDYETLNRRVEQDSEEQRLANEAAREEWRRNHPADQTDDCHSLQGDPFKPIHSLVNQKTNGHIYHEAQGNGHIIHVKPSSSSSKNEDSPSSSSHTVGESGGEGTYIPLHSPTQTSSKHSSDGSGKPLNFDKCDLDSSYFSAGGRGGGDEGVYIPLHSPGRKTSHTSYNTSPGGGDGGTHITLHSATTTLHKRTTDSEKNSPDSSSHSVISGDREKDVQSKQLSSDDTMSIPLPAVAEPDVLIISQPQPPSVVAAVREQFEWKMHKQRKNRKLLTRRVNRTAPTSATSTNKELSLPQSMSRVLPPLKTPSCTWARPGTAPPGLPTQGWGLTLALEEVCSPSDNDLSVKVVRSPHSLISSDSDQDDVVVAFGS